MAAKNQAVAKADGVWAIGKNYFVRSVTHYYTGRLVRVTPLELVLADAAWIADTGRFSDALRSGTLNEVEPYPGEVVINRGALVDACLWDSDLPRAQK
jgi:hypothetical protein